MDGTRGMNVFFHQYRNPWYCLDPAQAGATSLAALLALYYSSKKEYLSSLGCLVHFISGMVRPPNFYLKSTYPQNRMKEEPSPV
jgi:hypothetical protein